jgi:putative multiple sugar transport system substrate-binding protein
MIVNSLMTNTPIHTSPSIAGIPAIYSKITVVTQE